MRKSKVILEMMVITLLVILGGIGCTNKNEKLNQTEVLGNTEEELVNTDNNDLKVVSKEVYKFDSAIMKKNIEEIYFNKDGNVILANRLNYQMETAVNTLNEIELKDGVAKVLRNESKKVDPIYDNRRFYMKPLENNKVNIYNKIGDRGYIVDYAITEGTPFMTLLDNILLTPKQSERISATYIEGFKWINLDNNYKGEIVFDNLINISNIDKLGNKLYILYATELAVDYSNNIMVVNLDTSKIELDIKIDDASFIRVIDDKRILIEKGMIETEYSVSIYNLDSKISKELIKWEAGTNWLLNAMNPETSIKLSPDGDKILYSEEKDNIFYLRVAEIEGMDIKEAKEIFSCEVDSGLDGEFNRGLVTNFSDDGKSVILVSRMNAEAITEIKFNK